MRQLAFCKRGNLQARASHQATGWVDDPQLYHFRFSDQHSSSIRPLAHSVYNTGPFAITQKLHCICLRNIGVRKRLVTENLKHNHLHHPHIHLQRITWRKLQDIEFLRHWQCLEEQVKFYLFHHNLPLSIQGHSTQVFLTLLAPCWKISVFTATYAQQNQNKETDKGKEPWQTQPPKPEPTVQSHQLCRVKILQSSLLFICRGRAGAK